jgi:hypothetical protein
MLLFNKEGKSRLSKHHASSQDGASSEALPKLPLLQERAGERRVGVLTLILGYFGEKMQKSGRKWLKVVTNSICLLRRKRQPLRL